MAAAARRASCRSSSVQQLPKRMSPSRWSYSCIDTPITSWPWSASMAAATDESTPPDMATTILIVLLYDFRPRGFAGRHLPEPFDDGGEDRDDVIDLLLCIGRAQAEADGVLRPVQRESHRLEHVRRLQRAGRAGGPGRYGDTFEVQGDQQRLRLDPVEADVRGIWHPQLPIAIDHRPANGAEDAGFESITKLTQP